MSSLDASRFREFFHAVHGPDRDPFPWQERLVAQVCEGPWPRVIALPTAAGKTTCLDIAVFALACQADWGAKRNAPRRIFFVVDRRVIVDQAFMHACCIAADLRAAKSGILQGVADRLRSIAEPDPEKRSAASPLDCYQLRGGVYRDDAWARTPLQPTIIASTVDQVGSRLLHRGYGLRSGFARPIHAGLTGNDSLILLDEAHCSRPFGETAEAIERYRSWAAVPLPVPFQFVEMTATPGEGVPPEQIVRDEAEDRAHPVLGARIGASKPTRLVIAQKAKGKDWRKRLSLELTEQAEVLMEAPVQAVGVIVNRVATARAVWALLRERNKNADVVLLTGRMRPLDRDRVVGQWLRRLASGSEQPLERPLFVVATQCLEVGADLDFHALVSECASLDALRQRFGRLNRMAARNFAPGCIVIRADQVDLKDKLSEQDPVYGNSLPHTWAWLQAHSSGDVTEMGVACIREHWDATSKEDRERLNAPSACAPVLLPAHLDCWEQTAPAPSPDPDPAIFLHGPGRGIPDVQVVWRADLPDKPEDWGDLVALCPPSSAEAMPVPLPAFRAWLAGEDRLDEGGDVEGGTTSDEDTEEPAENRRALRWCGPDSDDTSVVEDPRDIHPGDTLVLPVSSACWDQFGHIPEGSPSGGVDLGEMAFQQARDLPILRLTPALIGQWQPDWLTKDRDEHLKAIREAEDDSDRDDLLDDFLLELEPAITSRDWLVTALNALRSRRHRTIEHHPAGGVVVTGKRRLHKFDPNFTDEDDSSAESSEAVPLVKHCVGVEGFARRFAAACGLEGLIETLALAGRWHDLGKADPRFQALLRRTSPRYLLRNTDLLAKSATAARSRRDRRLDRDRSRYPSGGRHELLSVRLVGPHLDGLPAELDRDLLLHLLASHHGRCRPFAPPIKDDAPEPVQPFDLGGVTFEAACTRTDLERLDSGVADRFWRLVRKYGWWGLSYLESILRLADHRRSEEEERGTKS